MKKLAEYRIVLSENASYNERRNIKEMIGEIEKAVSVKMQVITDTEPAAGAEVVGAGIAVEKEYQGGGNIIRERGIRVESLAKIASLDENGITFCS